MRRDQLRAVSAEVTFNPFFKSEAEVLKEVTSEDLVAAALASGECNSVRSLLQKKNLEGKMKVALQCMEIVQRRVQGSEADRRQHTVPRGASARPLNESTTLPLRALHRLEAPPVIH